MNNFQTHLEYFKNYANEYIKTYQEPCLNLKKEHTYHVVENAIQIAENLMVSEKEMYIAKLTALYHDLGRFYQYSKYKTFVDRLSENHAHIAVKLLKKNKLFLQEPKEIQQQVLCAIVLHNVAFFPKNLKKEYILQSNIIRDADKIDILKIMAHNFSNTLPEKDSVLLHVKDEPNSFTPLILEQAIHKQPIKYTDLKYANDFKILLTGWFYSLNFTISKKLVIKSDVLTIILNSLPSEKKINEFKEMVQKDFIAYS